MWQQFCQWMLYRRLGWKANITVDLPDKFIICLAPHTSNWDFLLGQLYSGAEGIKIGFLMKKEWFFWPLGYLFRALGGVPVHRSRKTSLTDQLAERARESKTFRLCITPEGTRKATAEWKKGFYFIALKADMPILLYGLDYERKLIECTQLFKPTGNMEADMPKIKSYFKGYRGKKPENFTTGLGEE